MLAASRDMDRRLVGGVCAGIASRYHYRVSLVRLATVLLSVATAGLGFIAYVALWRFLPAQASVAVDQPVSGSAVTGADLGVSAPGVGPDDPYAPVRDDLPRVRELMLSISSEVEFAFLREMIDQALTGEGKLMRPAIALLAGRLGPAYPLDRLVPLAASVELLHTATLVHDDVIDEADERRGEKTSAALFGNAASVMLGDYMFAHAAEFISRTDDTVVVRKFAQTLMMMATGELTQDVTAYEYSEDVQRYVDRIIGKTASLFATAAECGAIVGGVAPEVSDAMRLYGMRLGIAFQIVDDVLDFTGDPELMGKPVGSDLRSGTLTLPAILYMQGRADDNPVKLAFEGTDRNENFDRAIQEILDSDALTRAMDTAGQFASEARAALEAVPAGESRAALELFIDRVLERHS